MALTDRQLKAREGKLTASRVACLMEGDAEEIHKLWLELTGDPEFEPPDFSDNWHVKLGEATEQLNLDWFAKKYGPVEGRGLVRVHPDIPWAAVTLDGWSVDHECPIECKHLIGFTPTVEASVKYMPQMTWQMIVTNSDKCAFSPIQGGRPPEVIFCSYDKDYARELLRRAEDFMKHVHNLTQPVALPPVEAKVEAVKEYDMDGNEEFKNAAMQYRTDFGYHKRFEQTVKLLKKMAPADAVRVHGYGIEIKRAKNGALIIKENPSWR